MYFNADSCTYNRLRHIDTHKGNIDELHLQQLAKILIRHGAHREYSIKLLHRHFDISPGHVMVNRWVRKNVSQCTMEPVNQSSVYPCAYLALNHELVPYEYGEEAVTEPNADLAREAVDYLESKDLHHILGIGASLPSDQPWIEHQLADSAGTVTTPLTELDLGDFADDTTHIINTEWLIEETEGKIVLRQWKGCVDTKNDGHKKG